MCQFQAQEYFFISRERRERMITQINKQTICTRENRVDLRIYLRIIILFRNDNIKIPKGV